MDKEQYLSFLGGDTWLSQLARFNVVYGDKPDSNIARQIENSFNYSAFRDSENPYKHLEAPFKEVANTVFTREYRAYGLTENPDVGGVDYGTRVLRDALDFSTVTAFEGELGEGFRSTNRVLRKVFGHTFATDILGVEASQFDEARSSLFGAVFDRVEASFGGTSHTPLVVNENNNSAMYIPALEKQMTELAAYDINNSYDQYNRVSLDLQNLNRETAMQEAMRSLGSGFVESYDPSGKLPTNVLDKFRYINRPGILPVVDMLNRAGSEITIDIYQLQNPVIRGFILGKVANAAIHGDDLNLTLRMANSTASSTTQTGYDILGPNLMLAKELSMLNTMLQKDAQLDPFDRRFGNVNINFQWSGKRSHTKLLMTDKGALIGTANFTEPMGESIYQAGFAFETVRQIKNNFDPEKQQIINQYFDDQLKASLNKKRDESQYSNEELKEIGLADGHFIEFYESLPWADSSIDSDTYLYLQSRYLNEYIKRGYKLPTRLGTIPKVGAPDRPVNLGGAGDTYDLMKKALKELTDVKTPGRERKFYGFLNQTFVLDMKPLETNPLNPVVIRDGSDEDVFRNKRDSSLIRGEMGDEAPETLENEFFKKYIHQKHRIYQKEIQIPLFNALLENKANLIVDSHNYEEKILDPVYKDLLKDKRFTRDADYNIRRYVDKLIKESGVDRNTSATLQVGALKTALDNDSEFTRAIGTNRVTSLAYQLLAITSGNIEKAIVPFSHAKMFASVEFDQAAVSDLFNQHQLGNLSTQELINLAVDKGLFQLIQGKMGSSNMGLYSLNLGADLSDIYKSIDQQYTNSELDLLFDYSYFVKERNEDVKGYQQEEIHFLKMLAQSMSALTSKTRLTNGLIYTDVNPEELYQRNLDRARMEQLFTSLDQLSEDSQYNNKKFFSVSRVIDDSGIKEVIVSVPTMKGNKSYRFAVLKDSISKGGLYSVLAIDQGRIINRIAFANTSGIDVNIGLDAIDGSMNNDGTTIMKGRRVFLDPIQSTISLISSLVLEKQVLQSVKSPLDYIREMGGFDPFMSDRNNNISKLINVFLAEMFSTDLVVDKNGGYDLQKTLANLNSRSNPRREEIRRKAMRNAERFLFEYGLEEGRAQSKAGYVRALAGLGENANITDEYSALGIKFKEFVELTRDPRSRQIDMSRSSLYQEMVVEIQRFLSNEKYVDFIEFFVRTVGSSEVSRQLNIRLNSVDRKLFETFLTPTQQRVYSATQSYDQMPLYGISGQNTYAAQVINQAIGSGPNQLVRRALMHLPFSFGPADYLGSGFTSFVKVAEGSGSKLGRGGRAYGDVDVLDFIEEGEAKTGTIYDMAIINETRVGVMIRKDDLDLYRKELAEQGVTIDDLSSHIQEDMAEKEELLRQGKAFLIFHFSKLSQTSQRLKNALGARPLMSISGRFAAFLDYSYAMDLKDSSRARSKYDRSYAVFKEKVIKNYLGSFVTDENLKEKILKIEGSGIDYAAQFSGAINTMMGPRALNLIRQVEEEVNEEYSEADEAIKREIVRIRLVNNELTGVTKGLIGNEKIRVGETERASVMLVAMSGAYSDFAYGNPLYRYSNNRIYVDGFTKPDNFFIEAQNRGWKGARTGFLDQATKSIKSSLLALDLEQLKSGADGIFYTFDSEMSSVLKQGERAYFDFNLGVAIIAEADGGQRIINSRAELNVLKGAIHKSGNRIPSAGVVTAASNVPSAMGENGIEYMFATNFLDGSIHGNEIRKQIQYIRSQIASNRRLDSSGGGLIKAPLPVGAYDMWQRIAGQMGISIGEVAGVGDSEINISQIFALGSVSNIKSYLLEHGSNLLTTEKAYFTKQLELMGNVTSVASALLMSFNDDFLESGIDKKNLYDTLFENIKRGDMGNRFKGMALAHEMMNVGRADVAEAFFNSYRAKNADKNHLTTLRLNNKDIRDLFRVSNGSLVASDREAIEAVKKVLSLGEDEVYLGRTTKLSYLSNRERAVIASQLNIILQLTEQNNQLSGLPLMPLFSNKDYQSSEKDYALSVVKALMGFSQTDDDEFMETFMDVYSNNHAVLSLFISASPSQSKVATSKKATANIELQELLERSFLGAYSTFEKGSRVDNIRKHVAEIYALMTGSSSTRQFESAYTGEILDLITLDVIGTKEDKSVLASNLMVRGLAYHKNPMVAQTNLMNRLKAYSVFAYFNDEQMNRVASSLLANRTFKEAVLNSDITAEEAAQTRVNLPSLSYLKDTVVRNELFRAVVIARRKSGHDHSLGKDILKHLKKEMFKTVNELRLESIPYNLDPNESYLSKAETVVSELIKSEFNTGSVVFPTFTSVRGKGGSLGNIKVKADFTQMNYGIILGPKAIRALGEQFGGFQSELAASALGLYKALDPDSVVFQALTKFRQGYSNALSNNLDPQTLEVDLTQQQAQALMNYQDDVLNFYQLAAKELSGRYVQEIMGNRVRAKGGTLVGIASFSVGQREAVIPDIFNTKFDIIQSNDPRMMMARQIAAAMGSAIDFSDTYISNDLIQKLARSGITALVDGMSNKTAVVEFLKTSSASIRDKISQELGLNLDFGVDKGISIFETRANSIQEKLNHYKTYIDYLDYGGKGDVYLKHLANAEYLYLSSLFKYHYLTHQSVLTGFSMGQDTQDYIKARNTLTKLDEVRNLTIFNGFLGTPDARPNTDPDNLRLAPAQLEGKLGGVELDKRTSRILKHAAQDPRSMVNYLESLITQANSSTQALLEGLVSSIEGTQAVSSQLKELNDRFVENLRSKIEALSTMDGSSVVNESFRQGLRLDIIEFMSNSNATRFNFKRSPPPGYLHLSVTGNLHVIKLDEVNRRIKEDHGVNLFADSELNKSLGIFNPISYLAPNLGDFDGDSMSGIMLDINSLEMEKANLMAARDQLGSPATMIRILPDGSTLLLGESSLGKKEKKWRAQFNDLTEKINRVDAAIADFRTQDNYQEFETRLRTWVNDYTKLGAEIVDTFTTGEILTYVTQTKGLFPNLERAYSKNKQMLDSLAETYTALSLNGGANVGEKLHDKQYDHLNNIMLLRTVYGQLSEEERLALGELDSEARVRGFFGAKIAENAMINNSLQKFSQLAQGQGVSDETMDFYNAMLGKAGSYLLGQTYNNTIGMLYTKSPLLAIASSLSNGIAGTQVHNLLVNDDQLRARLLSQLEIESNPIRIEGDVDNPYAVKRSEADYVLHRLRDTANNVKSGVDRLGALIQNIHQLMRDSIKLKSEAKGVQDIETLVERYQSADTEEARKTIIDELSRGLDVQPLYYLDDMLKGMSTMNVDLGTDFDSMRSGVPDLEEQLTELDKSKYKAVEAISKTFNWSVDEIEQRQQRLLDRLGTETVSDYVKRLDKDINIHSGGLLATYETKTAIVSMLTDFAITNLDINENRSLTSKLTHANSPMGRGAGGEITLTASGMFANLSSTQAQAIALLANTDFTTDPTNGQFSLEQKEFIDFLAQNENVNKAFDNVQLAEEGIDSREADARKVLIANAFLNSRSAANAVFGEFGEDILTLQQLNNTRKSISSASGQELENYLASQEDATLTQAIFQNLQTGKVTDPDAMGAIFRSLVSMYGGRAQVSEAQVLRSTMDMIVQNPDGFALNNEETLFYETVSEILRADEAASGNAANEILDIVRATEMGQKTATVAEILQYFTETDPQNEEMRNTNARNVSDTHKNTVRGILEKYVGSDVAKALDTNPDFSFNYSFFIEDNDKRVQNFLSESIKTSVEKGMSKDLEAFSYRVNTGSALAEIGLFPALSLIGGLMSAQSYGEGSPEALIEQTIGNSLMAFAYNQSSFGALGQAVSAGFKARMTARSGDDPLGAVANLLMQETAAALIFSAGPLVDSMREGIDRLGNEGVGGAIKSVINGVSSVGAKAGEIFSDTFGGGVASLVGFDLESYGKSHLDYENNLYLKKATSATVYNIAAGAAVYTANSFLNWLTNRKPASDDDRRRAAMEQVIGEATVEEKTVENVVNDYTAASNNQQSTEPSGVQVINSDGSTVGYETEEYYDSAYYNQVSNYAELDGGYEIVIGQTQYLDYALSV